MLPTDAEGDARGKSDDVESDPRGRQNPARVGSMLLIPNLCPVPVLFSQFVVCAFCSVHFLYNTMSWEVNENS